jgi:hypothetical protein
MRSGEILPFSGPTSIWREVQGPVILSFWWKADSIQVCIDPAVMCKGLSLLIDGKTQWICNSSDWKEARFPLTDGLHRVEWLFKPRSDQKGIGWLDDVSLAPFPTATPTTYANHSLSFNIPDGWKVAKDDIEGNDTQVVLSDGTNAIRIDLIKHPGIGILIGDYLDYHVSKSELDSYAYNSKDNSSEAWKSNYERIPWYSNDAISEYYMEHVIHPIALAGNNWHGSGISVKPDGVEYAGFYTNENSRGRPVDVYEWVIAWTKPSYDEKFIGVHSVFKGEFRQIKIELSGSNDEYIMPEPLWTVLTSFSRGDKPRSLLIADQV